jgi:hypothetical protein
MTWARESLPILPSSRKSYPWIDAPTPRQGSYQLGPVSQDTNDALRPPWVRAWEALTVQLLVASPESQHDSTHLTANPCSITILIPARPNKTIGDVFENFLLFASQVGNARHGCSS